MKLFEIAGFNAGLWISPAGQIVEVANTHIDDVINHPDKFGLTLDHIKRIYQKYGEQLHQEGEAREEIIRDVLVRGWIRVRKYRNYWSMTLDSLKDSTKRIVKNFVNTLIKNNIMSENDDIKILEIRSDNLKTLEASDILDNSLEESLDILPFVTFDKVASMLNESSLSRIHNKLQNHACGAITAYRGEYTYKQNQERNRILLAKLQRAGYQVTSIRGTYIENHGSDDAKDVNENSFFVVAKSEGSDGGRLEHTLCKLGEEFDQDTILSIPYGQSAKLIGTTHRDNSFLGFGQTAKVGKFKGGKVAEFMSKIGDRSFTFEAIKLPDSNMGKWAMKLAAETDWKDVI